MNIQAIVMQRIAITGHKLFFFWKMYYIESFGELKESTHHGAESNDFTHSRSQTFRHQCAGE